MRDWSQLNIIIQQPYLLTGLERRQPNVRASVAAESISQCAVATGADLALDGEVNFVEIVGSELDIGKLFVGGRALGSVLDSKTLGKAAGAIFAGATALANLWLAFGSWRALMIRDLGYLCWEQNMELTYEC